MKILADVVIRKLLLLKKNIYHRKSTVFQLKSRIL